MCLLGALSRDLSLHLAGKETVEARQLSPEKGMPPLKQVKATARSAHVDQDEDYARVICKRAAGEAEIFGAPRLFLSLTFSALSQATTSSRSTVEYRSSTFGAL